MGTTTSKDEHKNTNDTDNTRSGHHGAREPSGRPSDLSTNRYLDREQRPRNTHDDLFSTDPFQPHTDIRPIDELRQGDAYVNTNSQRIDERLRDTDVRRVQQRVNDTEPIRDVRRLEPVGRVDRWAGGDPWLGRDGWPDRQPHGVYDERHGYAPQNQRHAGYQIVKPPRYEDVVPVRRPAPRPQQPIETQQSQVPVLLANQKDVNRSGLNPEVDDAHSKNKQPAEDNLQNVEVESLLSYGQGGENDATKKTKDVTKYAKPANMSAYMTEEGIKVPNDESALISERNANPQVKTFKEDDDEYIGANLRFYRNEIKFRPHGEHIDNIHKYWYGDYQRLENSQTYIQWLFPLAERSSVNPYALPLQKHEAKYIKDDDETYGRVVTSFQMMLDFYGMTLADPNTGEVSRSGIWRERFAHLKRSGKNYFRITRIIRSLGALGLYLYQAPFVMFLLHEVLETKELAAVPPGIVNTWLGAIDNAFDREYVRKQFQHPLNDMNNLYEKKNVKIRVQDNVYYESARQKDKDEDAIHRHRIEE